MKGLQKSMAIRQRSQILAPARSESNAPNPRGNGKLAMLGSVFLFLAVAISVLLVRFHQSLPQAQLQFIRIATASPVATSTPKSVQTALLPAGEPLPGFAAYQSTLLPIAVYKSITWQADPSALYILNASQPALVFHPISSILPSMQLTVLPAATTPAMVIPDLANIYSALQQTSFSVVQPAYAISIQGQSWTAVDATVSQNGVGLSTRTYLLQERGSTVVVMTESLGITFDQTNTQDFLPMLKSLVVGG